MVAWALVPRDPILEVPHTVISMVKEDQLTDSECITKDTFTTTTITTTVDRTTLRSPEWATRRTKKYSS